MHSRIFGLRLASCVYNVADIEEDKHITREDISESDLPFDYMTNTMCDYFNKVDKEEEFESVRWLVNVYPFFKLTHKNGLDYLTVNVEDIANFNRKVFEETKDYINSPHTETLSYVIWKVIDKLIEKSGFYIIDRDNNGYTPYTLYEMLRDWEDWYREYKSLTFLVEGVFDYHN